MAADPLKDVLQKVVNERQMQIETLNGQLRATFDPVVQDDLQKKIATLHSELVAAEQALMNPAPAEAAPQPQLVEPAPDPVAATVNPDPQLLAGEPILAPKAPSKAGLEAQIRELSTQLMDAAHAVEKAGLSPNPMDVEHLNTVRAKLQAALQQAGTNDLSLGEGELPPRPTPSQLAEADGLIKRSMLEKRRGNTRGAGDLLRQAADVAPGSPSVLEALGDDIMERGQAKPAAEIYAKALRIQPTNTGIERKYALAVAKSKGAVTVEEALQMSLGDKPLSGAEAATSNAAAIFSFLIPGVGQAVLGDYVRAGVFLGLWLLMILWLYLMPGQLQNALGALVFGKHISYSPIVFLPIVGMLAVQITAAFTCKKEGKTMGAGAMRKPKGSRPAPPVDLPFE